MRRFFGAPPLKNSFLTSSGILGSNEILTRSLRGIAAAIRNASTKPSTNGDIKPFVYNRNPRNLERLRIEKKPVGYTLDDIFIEYWHKLELAERSEYVIARVVHNTDKVVVEASTDEWAIYKQLYSKTDKMAYLTLARVFAQRCLETGMYRFACNIPQDEKDTKVNLFLRTLVEEGLSLSEPSCYDYYNKHVRLEKKPWTVLED